MRISFRIFPLLCLSLAAPAAGCRGSQKSTDGDAGSAAAISGPAQARATSTSDVGAAAPDAGTARHAAPLHFAPACNGWSPHPIKTEDDATALVNALGENLKRATATRGKEAEAGALCDAFFDQKAGKSFLSAYRDASNVDWSVRYASIEGGAGKFRVSLGESMDASSDLDPDHAFDKHETDMSLFVTVGRNGRIVDWSTGIDTTDFRVADDIGAWLPCTKVPIVPKSAQTPSQIDPKTLAARGLIKRLESRTEVNAFAETLSSASGARAQLLNIGNKPCWAMRQGERLYLIEGVTP